MTHPLRFNSLNVVGQAETTKSDNQLIPKGLLILSGQHTNSQTNKSLKQRVGPI
jgi:hypothetical protein